jgi:hypothetical protein
MMQSKHFLLNIAILLIVFFEQYPQKLTLTSLTSGGRLVGIVRSRTKVTEFGLVLGRARMRPLST